MTHESNILLRQEKEKLAGKLKAAEEKATSLDASIAPLTQKAKKPAKMNKSNSGHGRGKRRSA